MARRKKKKTSVVGVIVVAIILGLVIGVVIFNPYDAPLPPPPKVDFADEYDDDWGKLDAPVSSAKVTHILISWKDASPQATPKDPERTQQEARDLVEEIWNKYRNNPEASNWVKLQAEYNEDSQPHTEYEVNRSARLVQPFKDCAKSTKPGFARICESQFGYHLIRRNK